MNILIQFQKNNGLTPDGKLGVKTAKKIKEVFNIPTIEAAAHFIGNVDHETGGFIAVEENLNYSADGLIKVFTKYFPTKTIALQYSRKPEKIANKVYANRMGNGNELSGDGWKYRGRGALQLTGYNNYKDFGNYLNIDIPDNPDLVADMYAWESAVYYFERNNLWKMADSINDDTIRRVRKAVNGGSIGLEDVNGKVKKYYSLLKL